MQSSKSIPSLVAHGFIGLVFVVFSLNFWSGQLFGSGFFSMPPMPEAAGSFMGALMASGFFMPVLKVIELVGGVLVLSRKFAPLGLLLLSPVIVSIALFHFFLAPGPMGLAMSILLLAAAAYLGFGVYWHQFRHVIQAEDAMEAQAAGTYATNG
jgi:hypothetical protein